jgi:small subunit ribosomal protein S18
MTPTEDPFDLLGLDPLKEYKNFTLLSHFVSDMGKILPREQTGKGNGRGKRIRLFGIF